jgi:ribosomal subunit interface protein
MNIQLTFRDFPSSDAIRAYVEQRAAKALAKCDRLVSARVTLAAPHKHHKHGHSFRVAIDVVLPGHEIVVSPRDGAEGHADLYAAIDDAFDDVVRQLHDRADERRSETRARAAE